MKFLGYLLGGAFFLLGLASVVASTAQGSFDVEDLVKRWVVDGNGEAKKVLDLYVKDHRIHSEVEEALTEIFRTPGHSLSAAKRGLEVVLSTEPFLKDPLAGRFYEPVRMGVSKLTAARRRDGVLVDIFLYPAFFPGVVDGISFAIEQGAHVEFTSEQAGPFKNLLFDTLGREQMRRLLHGEKGDPFPWPLDSYWKERRIEVLASMARFEHLSHFVTDLVNGSNQEVSLEIMEIVAGVFRLSEEAEALKDLLHQLKSRAERLAIKRNNLEADWNRSIHILRLIEVTGDRDACLILFGLTELIGNSELQAEAEKSGERLQYRLWASQAPAVRGKEAAKLLVEYEKAADDEGRRVHLVELLGALITPGKKRGPGAVDHVDRALVSHIDEIMAKDQSERVHFKGFEALYRGLRKGYLLEGSMEVAERYIADKGRYRLLEAVARGDIQEGDDGKLVDYMRKNMSHDAKVKRYLFVYDFLRLARSVKSNYSYGLNALFARPFIPEFEQDGREREGKSINSVKRKNRVIDFHDFSSGRNGAKGRGSGKH